MARGHDEPRAAAPRIERDARPHIAQSPNAARVGGWPADETTSAQMPAPAAPRASSARDASRRRRAQHQSRPAWRAERAWCGGHGQDKRQ